VILLVALNIVSASSSTESLKHKSKGMTGIESIYEMNKYTKTRSYNLLKIIYTCVKDCALDSKGNNLIGAYRKK
jgi:hypothetical protein